MDDFIVTCEHCQFIVNSIRPDMDEMHVLDFRPHECNHQSFKGRHLVKRETLFACMTVYIDNKLRLADRVVVGCWRTHNPIVCRAVSFRQNPIGTRMFRFRPFDLSPIK
jgi:hypothetical protein